METSLHEDHIKGTSAKNIFWRCELKVVFPTISITTSWLRNPLQNEHSHNICWSVCHGANVDAVEWPKLDLLNWVSARHWRLSRRKSRKSGCSFFAYSWKLPAYSGAFLLTIDSFSFLAYNWSLFAYNGKVRLIRALRDCKQRSLTVSTKAPAVSKKLSPVKTEFTKSSSAQTLTIH